MKSTVFSKITDIIIPTYGLGKPEINPVFFEKRVYQGSNGKVYPVPFIDKVFDQKEGKEYQVATLENEFVKLEMLPEIGGRIFNAQDKTNGNYDIFYRQDVIKPALVGLAGPWISGGVEFNWPQHHRPGTYLPTDVFNLMAGVFTDNQPDFTYLVPFETKTFSQYWWGYQKLGPVQNANRDLAIRLEILEGNTWNNTGTQPAIPNLTGKRPLKRIQKITALLSRSENHCSNEACCTKRNLNSEKRWTSLPVTIPIRKPAKPIIIQD